MTVVVLLILAVLWAAYLIPIWMRSRPSSGPRIGLGRPVLGGAGSTNRLVGGATGSVVPLSRAGLPAVSRGGRPAGLGAIPRSPEAARRRRQQVLLGLACLAALTLLGALALGGILWVVHLLVDMALLGFGYLVHERETRQREREQKVHRFPAPRRVEAHVSAPIRRRAAN